MLIGFSLLANDPRVTVWTTCSLFKGGANKNHVIRQPTYQVVPRSQRTDASSGLPLIRVAGAIETQNCGPWIQGLWREVKSKRSFPISILPKVHS